MMEVGDLAAPAARRQGELRTIHRRRTHQGGPDGMLDHHSPRESVRIQL